MAQIGALAILVLMAGGSLLKRAAGERTLRVVLTSRGWTGLEIRYRPTVSLSRRARFHVSGSLPDGHRREGLAYVGSFTWAPPFDKTVRLWDPYASPTEGRAGDTKPLSSPPSFGSD